MEGPPREPAEDPWELADIGAELAQEPELLRYMLLLPKELWGRHMKRLEEIRENSKGEDAATQRERRINYLLDVVQGREKAITDMGVGEPALEKVLEESFGGPEKFGDRLRELLVTKGNYLGSGMTARVKSLAVEGFDQSIAVKYVLSPTAQTLSAQGEYDALREVKILLDMEQTERQAGAGEHLRTPHPFFYYKRGKMQCYGMSQVRGMDLARLTEGEGESAERAAFTETLRSKLGSEEAQAAVEREVEAFMRGVHEVCLHGDIKLANLMVDEDGALYLIDFGQSVHANTLSEKTREQYENLEDHEVEQVRECLRVLWRHLRT